MPPPVVASKGMTVSLLSEVTTGTGTGVVIPTNSRSVRITARGAGTIASGTLIIEEAATYDYSGTWSQLQSTDLSSLTDGEELVTRFDGNIGAIRARLAADVVGGGTVSVDLVTN